MIYFNVRDIIGLTFPQVKKNDDNTELVFVAASGNLYKFTHIYTCSETVTIEDIEGDLSDLENTEILNAEIVTNREDTFGIANDLGSFTWTFYKFVTTKGYVTVRWLGESNGNYSEEVDLVFVPVERVAEEQGNKKFNIIDGAVVAGSYKRLENHSFDVVVGVFINQATAYFVGSVWSDYEGKIHFAPCMLQKSGIVAPTIPEGAVDIKQIGVRKNTGMKINKAQ